MERSSISAPLAVLLLIWPLLTWPLAAQGIVRVGSAAAVRNDVRGTVVGQMRTGSPVHQRETVSSGTDSSAQLLFRDKTSLTLGPNSQVTIDKFVYDPAPGAGQVAVRLFKGALRVVSGSTGARAADTSTHVSVRGGISSTLNPAEGTGVPLPSPGPGTIGIDGPPGTIGVGGGPIPLLPVPGTTPTPPPGTIGVGGGPAPLPLPAPGTTPTPPPGTIGVGGAPGVPATPLGPIPPGAPVPAPVISTIGITGPAAPVTFEAFVSDLGHEIVVLVEGRIQVCAPGAACQAVTTPGDHVVVSPDGTISAPTAWPGPMLDLTASVNFVQTHFSRRLERGNDVLPRYRDLNEALRTRDLVAPQWPPEPCGSDVEGGGPLC